MGLTTERDGRIVLLTEANTPNLSTCWLQLVLGKSVVWGGLNMVQQFESISAPIIVLSEQNNYLLVVLNLHINIFFAFTFVISMYKTLPPINHC